MSEIYRNSVIVTSVYEKRGKQFAFGVVLEPEVRTIFFPYWIIQAYQITTHDQGEKFDCLFVDRTEDRSPVVIAILDDDLVAESTVVGHYSGRPGSPDFTAMVNELNGKQA